MQDAGCRLHGRVFWNMNREPRRYSVLPFRYRYSVRVPGPRYLAPGTRDRINAEDRTPSTGDRTQRAQRVCILPRKSSNASAGIAVNMGRG